LEDLGQAVPGVFAAELVRDLGARTEARLVAGGELLEERRAAGLVRHCHGDLHLGNIVLVDERPVLFDCIEFNDDFACIDVLYDLAFLAMDLIEKGHRPAATRLLNGWLERTTDHAGLALLPLFLSLRAVIRAKVTALAALREPGGDTGEPRRYLDLGSGFLTPPAPTLLTIGGGSGTGKTTLARALAPAVRGPAPGAMILRSDVIRKQLFGRAPTDRLPPDAYTAEVSARVFAILAGHAATCLRAGHSVVADGVYGQADQRAAIVAVARAQGVPFHGIWLEAPLATLVSRVEQRRGDASDAHAAVVRRQADSIDAKAVAWRRIAADRPVEAIAAEVLGTLNQATDP
jgi:predicted kinase